MFAEDKMYQDDVDKAARLALPWKIFDKKTVLISGSTGMIGSFLIDVLMRRNKEFDMDTKVFAVGRSEEKARNRFFMYWDNPCFLFLKAEIDNQEDLNAAVNSLGQHIDYIVHLASNTHPVAYAEDPIGTITANIIGTNNLLKVATVQHCERFVFASSNEIYGENRGDVELFDESYCGYIDSNTLRAGYPESKRCGEALCQAYIKQEGLDTVIVRFTRSYGPSMLQTDTKAISQFIKKAIEGEDIVLKSEGNQYYSYTYVADAVGGLLTILLKGDCGEAYNVVGEGSDIRLRDLAKMIADQVGRKVCFEIPEETESAGYSKATKARLDGTKIKALGWEPLYTIEEGVRRTIGVLKK